MDNIYITQVKDKTRTGIDRVSDEQHNWQWVVWFTKMYTNGGFLGHPQAVLQRSADTSSPIPMNWTYG